MGTSSWVGNKHILNKLNLIERILNEKIYFLQVDDIKRSDITQGDDYLIAIPRMLNQLATQLVKLRFLSNVLDYKGKSLFGNFDYIPPTRFKLPRMMSKLRLFRNDLVDIFRCSDDLFESMSALETLLIGDINRHPRFVNKILRNVCSAKMIWPTLRNLRIVELHDPQLLEGLQEAFPNLVKLTVDTRHAADFRRLNTTMKLPFVLPACLGWEGLKHLNLALPKYPEKIVDVIKILLDCKDLFTRECQICQLVIVRLQQIQICIQIVSIHDFNVFSISYRT